MDGGKVSVRRDRCICPVTLPSVLYKLQERREEKRGEYNRGWKRRRKLHEGKDIKESRYHKV